MMKKNNCKPSEWLSRIQAAEYLGVSVRTIDRLISQGQIPYYKLGQIGRRGVIVKLNKRDLDRKLEQQRVGEVL